VSTALHRTDIEIPATVPGARPTSINMRALLCISLLATAVGACGDGDDLDSDEEARRAYLGLDASVEKSITLGFAGFNSASSANISPQVTTGIEAGMLTVTGQVDQGTSDNKGMRLHIGMVDYSDGEIVIDPENDEETILITYNTDANPELQPFLSMQLKMIPTGTLEGTLMGTYTMTGDLEADVDLNLTFTGTLMDPGDGTVIRQPGSTHVTGTAVSGDGTFDVDITI
jgi:hypothetical protein